MKITRFIMLAVCLIVGLFAFSAFAGNRDTSLTTTPTASASAASVLRSNKQTIPFTGFTALYGSIVALVSNKNWVKERVGTSPLNVFRRDFETVQTLDGYEDALLKPKIGTLSRSNGFTGIGHDHFARADV